MSTSQDDGGSGDGGVDARGADGGDAGVAAGPITATVKGPDQINLTWSPAPDAGYDGYLVEIQSPADARYKTWTELKPIRDAGGYTCDSAQLYGGVPGCDVSDPTGSYVYNPPTNGVPYWVTEAQYVDPQDGTAAQFIAWGLIPNTEYSFRVRTYRGNAAPVLGAYSTPATARTAKYALRYVSPAGSDGNDGTAPEAAHAWRTLGFGSGHITCGQVLMVMGGDYASDGMTLSQSCSNDAKAVVLVNPGDTATITSGTSGSSNYVVQIYGSHVVIDGLAMNVSNRGEYDWRVAGDHNALLDISSGPAIVPTSRYGVWLNGPSHLVYRSYVHDYGSPMPAQNPNGEDGYPLRASTDGVVWSNHLTRGGHDSSLCDTNCSNNRWLNNVHDGGWGMAFEVVYDTSQGNLFEGATSVYAGRLEVSIYKPAFELSNGFNTVRRGIFADFASKGIEITSYGTATSNNGNLVYNNAIYGGQKCYFQSHNQGTSAYDGDMVVNNICTNFTGDATEIYMNNATPGAISYNTFLKAGGNGSEPIIVWYQESGIAPYVYPQTLAFAEANYGPAWAHDVALAVDPQYEDAPHRDYHLKSGSPLRGAGVMVVDAKWPWPGGATVDLGPYGIK